jgi:homoserine dehydrogenase
VDVRLAMTGFGNVGRGVAELLAKNRNEYEGRHGVRLLLTGVADRRGVAVDAGGLDEVELLRSKRESGSVSETSSPDGGVVGKEFLTASQANVLIEAASTNFDDAEPGWSLIKTALSLDLDVVLASKGALVLYYAELMALAASRDRVVAHSATIGAPLPVLDLTNRTLVGTRILGFEGVLNSTANVILQAMIDGKTYEEGVRLAQEMGIAETDPTLDVDGWDAAAKAAIVANAAFGCALGIADVAREGIRDVPEGEIAAAAQSGEKLKLLSMASVSDGQVVAEVRVLRRGPSHPLGRLKGSEMGILLHTDPLGDFTATVENLGASGGIATASTVLRDVLNLASQRGWNSARPT